jgi:hypothetical protein
MIVDIEIEPKELGEMALEIDKEKTMDLLQTKFAKLVKNAFESFNDFEINGLEQPFFNHYVKNIKFIQSEEEKCRI